MTHDPTPALPDQRPITVQTSDRGPVAVTCPSWCAGRHEDGEQLVDLGHVSENTELLVHTERGPAELAHLLFASYPFATQDTDHGPAVAVKLAYDYFSFRTDTALYQLADEIAAHAVRIRAIARQLAELQAAEVDR
ncbi:DUF6907 domain-containing protein [Kitasatospora sp. NPDC057198]|uniref:DUF6907 domain-containing protein n=1 Tax=Kitasatospora sp. NPDC057198 TaxID=3346046 RepID=UPI00362B85F9